MKKITTMVMVMISLIAFSQKKTNGTIYSEHPAIATVEAMTKAFVSGDSEKVSSYLSADFKEYNGNSIAANDKGLDKEAFSKKAKGWHDTLDYFSMTRSKGAYPDALEYKDDNQKDMVWVQTWEDLKGVHKKTGVKISMPMHRLFIVNKDNKIVTIINYLNSSISEEVRDSYADRTNGTIYNHHENINTIRKMIYAFENKDFEKCYSFYDTKATFRDSNSKDDKRMSLDELKAADQELLKNFEITSIDMVGYPDYLHYELGDARVVMSWWNYNLIRKSDKKAFVLPVHLSDDFDANGKIISETVYYNGASLK
jgi:hypothetical protein